MNHQGGLFTQTIIKITVLYFLTTILHLLHGCLESVEWNGGMDYWNGLLEWSTGMDWDKVFSLAYNL